MADYSKDVQGAVADAIKESGMQASDFSTAEGGFVAEAAKVTPTLPPRGDDGKFVKAGDGAAPAAGEGEGNEAAAGGEAAGGKVAAAGEVKEGGEGEGEGEIATPATVAEKLDDQGTDFKPTAEELAVIDQSPELRKVYRSMVKGLTEKTSALATQRKESELALKVVDEIKRDPRAAARALAKAAGMELVERDKDGKVKEPQPPAPGLEERLRLKLEAKIGKEAADVLAPVLLEAVGTVTAEKNAPVEQFVTEQRQKEMQTNLRNGIVEFGRNIVEDGGEFDEEVEVEMAKLVSTVLPGPGTTLPQYLEVLHNTVQTQRNKRANKGAAVERLQAAVKKAEPVRQSKPVTPAPKAIAAGMNEKDAVALAIQQAKSELAAGGRA